MDYIYCAGYYDSDTIHIQSNNSESVEYVGNNGLYDLVIAKYSPAGDLQWFNNTGGAKEDKIFDAIIHNDELVVAGHFTDAMFWGGIELTTTGDTDTDMFVGQLDSDGNYRSANSYAGRNNSWEEARATFIDEENTYVVIRTDSDLIILGDSIYTTSGDYFYVAFGVIGCLPITIGDPTTTDVITCAGERQFS